MIMLLPLFIVILFCTAPLWIAEIQDRYILPRRQSVKEIPKVYDPDAPVSDYLAKLEHENQEAEKTTGLLISGLSKHAFSCQDCYPPPDPAEIARINDERRARVAAKQAVDQRQAVINYMKKYPPKKLFYGTPSVPPKGVKATWITYAGGSGELEYDEASLSIYKGKSNSFVKIEGIITDFQGNQISTWENTTFSVG